MNTSLEHLFDEQLASGQILAPLKKVLQGRLYQRRKGTKSISDDDFMLLGILYCLKQCYSGRDFVQWSQDVLELKLPLSTFFGALHSARRLLLSEEVGSNLWKSVEAAITSEPFAGLDELKGRGLYAIDATELAHAVHAPKVKRKNGQEAYLPLKYNLMRCIRSGIVRCLGVCGSSEKREHELKHLKANRSMLESLPKRSLFVVDRGYIDLRFWYELNRSHRHVCITRLKENMKLMMRQSIAFDSSNPINHGVLDYAMIGFNNNTTWYLVTYQDPVTDTVYEFICNDGTLEPGVIAYLHLKRWSIEKTNDFLKNSLGETVAWANSNTAKKNQGMFIELTINLVALFLREQEQIGHSDKKVIDKAEKRLSKVKEQVEASAKSLSCLFDKDRTYSKISEQVIRWVRNIFEAAIPFARAQRRLWALLQSYI